MWKIVGKPVVPNQPVCSSLTGGSWSWVTVEGRGHQFLPKQYLMSEARRKALLSFFVRSMPFCFSSSSSESYFRPTNPWAQFPYMRTGDQSRILKKRKTFRLCLLIIFLEVRGGLFKEKRQKCWFLHFLTFFLFLRIRPKKLEPKNEVAKIALPLRERTKKE